MPFKDYRASSLAPMASHFPIMQNRYILYWISYIRYISYKIYKLDILYGIYRQTTSTFQNMLITLKLGHIGSKTRSPGQIFDKPRIHFRGYSFNATFMKLC